MSDLIPCPCCGSEQDRGNVFCGVCGYELARAGASNSGRGRCARCGSEMPTAFDFCPVCGLDQRIRRERPGTAGFRLHHPPAVLAAMQAEREARADPPRPGAAPSETQTHIPRAVQQPGPTARLHPVSEVALGRAHGQPRVVLVERDGSDGPAHPVGGDGFDIGRTQGHVTFDDDPFLCPLHARIERTPTGHALLDLGSRNGVYLRMTRIERVYPGDVFMVGRQVLRLDAVASSAADDSPDARGTVGFGTPATPAWGRLTVLVRGGLPGDVFHLRGTEAVLGRESGDIVFATDAFLSRQHARIRFELSGSGMNVLLEDMNSANGTYLRIRGRADLRANDSFRVGDHILRLRTD